MTDSEKLDLILQRLDRMDQRLDRMDQRLDRMDQRLDRVEQRQEATESQAAENRDLLDKIADQLKEVRELKLLVSGYTRNFSDILARHTGLLAEIRQKLIPNALNGNL